MNDEAMHEALRIDGDHIRKVWPSIAVEVLDLFSKAYAVARMSDSADATDEALRAIQFDPTYLALPAEEKALSHTLIGRGAIRVRTGWQVMRRSNGRPWRAKSQGPSWTHTRHIRIGASPLSSRRAGRRGRLSPSEAVRFAALVRQGLDDRSIADAMGITRRGTGARRRRVVASLAAPLV